MDTGTIGLRGLVSQAYIGPAKIYEFTGDNQGEELNLLGNSMVTLDDDVGAQDQSEAVRYARLVLRYPEDMCGRRCYVTQVEDLALCLKRDTAKLEPIT